MMGIGTATAAPWRGARTSEGAFGRTPGDFVAGNVPDGDGGYAAMPEVTAPPRRRRAWTPSPAVDRLRPRHDASASRVLARHGALTLGDDHDGSLDAAADAAAAALRAAVRMRRATRDAFAATARSMTPAFADGPSAVRRRFGTLPGRSSTAPLVVGATVRVDPAHLVDDGIGMAGIVHARATVMATSRGGMTGTWHPLPTSWRQHAAERALERSAAGVGGNVHLALAAELARLAPMVAVMADAARAEHPDAQVAVPFLDGLLLGSVDVIQPGIALSAQFLLSVTDGRRSGTDMIDAGRAWRAMLGLSAPATWTAMTFVGPDEMTRAQAAHAAAFARASERMTAGSATTFLTEQAVILHEGYERRLAAARQPPRERAAPSEGERAAANAALGEKVATLTGFDAAAARALARDALRSGAARIEPHGRDVCAAVPIRARDHDDDPFRRGLAAARIGARVRAVEIDAP